MSKVVIKLDTNKYKSPSQTDIDAAKKFILQREDNAHALESEIDELLADAAKKIVVICYKYDFDPKYLYFGSGFNEQMMKEISDVMDELEQQILDIIEQFALNGSPVEKEKRNALLLWLSTLGRENRNLRDTLDTYLYKFMKDLEAAIAALKVAGVGSPNAITKVKTHLHTIYNMPEVVTAFKEASSFAATFIQTRGVQKGGVGLSNNGSTNVTNMARLTLQMAWMRSRRMEMEDNGAAGFYVLRGSNYPCDLCDSKVGFHKMTDIESFPPYHGHCCCYVIPIYQKQVEV